MKVHVSVACVAAIVVAFAMQSCGPARCTPQSCQTGCCDSDGVCQLGGAQSACGRGGALCAACALGSSCFGGTCTLVTTGTGGGSPSGGGSAGGTSGGMAGGTAGGVAGGTSGGVAGGTAGGVAGGGAAGGAAGGTAGGVSGGLAGGVAGGVSGGGAAGGTSGGTAGGGAPDAGPVCAGTPFCVIRHTVRTDLRDAYSVVGETLTDGVGIFVRFTNPQQSSFVTHGPTAATSNGSSRVLSGIGPNVQSFGGSGQDFLLITESNLITASVRRFVDGGIPQLRYDGMCAGSRVIASTLYRAGNRVLIGGYDPGLCELNLATGQTTLLQAEQVLSPAVFVTGIYAPGSEVLYTTSDGYVNKLGVGRVSPLLDPVGMVGIGGTSGSDVWAIGDDGVIARRGADGGFSPFTQLPSRAYALEVTSDGVFVGTFGGLAHRTAYTDGGFETFALPAAPSHRVFGLSGGPGALHVVGNEGPFNTPTQAFFLTLQPRNQ